MAETSLAREPIAGTRQEWERRRRCNGSGFRPLKACTGCRESAGSISERRGTPPVRSPRDCEHHLVHCLPGFTSVGASATVDRMRM